MERGIKSPRKAAALKNVTHAVSEKIRHYTSFKCSYKYLPRYPSSIYNFLLTSVLLRNLRDLHIYQGFYGERNRAENCEKIIVVC